MNKHAMQSTLEALRGWFVRSGGRYLVPNIGTILVVALLLFATRVGAGPAGQEPVATVVPAGAGGQPAAEPFASTTTMSYQGRLTSDTGTPVNGSVQMTFRLYDVLNGGSPLWTEVHSGVQVSQGLFAVQLGSLSPLSSSLFAGRSTLFLGVAVGTDLEMTPREQLSSAAFAFASSNLADGATGGSLTLQGNLTVNGTDIVLKGRNSGGTGKGGRALIDGGTGNGLVINYDNDFGRVAVLGDTTIGGELRYKVLRQDKTTNTSMSSARIQTGWGYVQGDEDEDEVDKRVTFPSSFSEPPIVVLTSLGLDTGTPGSIDDFFGTVSQETTHATDISASGFKVVVSRGDGSDFTGNFYFGFSWIAIGR
jgi:hypothetical protein